jgi:hypothetical protein
MSQAPDLSTAETARAALAQHDWRAAFDLLREADGRGSLAADEMDLLAQAAWWVGQLGVAIDARERMYAAATKSGDKLTATLAAIYLGRDTSWATTCRPPTAG